MNHVKHWFVVVVFLAGAPACMDGLEEGSASSGGQALGGDEPDHASPAQVSGAMATLVAPFSDRVVVIHHVQSTRCLDGSISQGVRLNGCNGGLFQQWIVSDSNLQVQNVQSQLCLDGSTSQGVRLNTCNGGTFQQWSTTTAPEIVRVDGGLCLDGSNTQGVRLNTCNGGTFQQWLLSLPPPT